MDLSAASVIELSFILVFGLVFFFLRHYLFNKFKGVSYFLLFIGVLVFGTGCFFMGKNIDLALTKAYKCPYVENTLICYAASCFDIAAAGILLIYGLVHIFGVIESLEVAEENVE